MKTGRSALLAGLCWWGVSFLTDAGACPVPVYEIAFYRWLPDDYLVTVEYDGALSNVASAKAVELLRPRSVDKRERANMNVEFRQVEGRERNDSPLMRVSYIRNVMRSGDDAETKAQVTGITNEVWSGTFTAAAAAALVDSPVRQAVKQRLLAGDVAVWILLESGDKAKDDRIARLVDETLKDIRATMKAPAPPEDPANLDTTPADAGGKAVSLSLVRVARDDPAEWFLAAMLRQFPGTLRGDREPVLAAVFGRGMVLKPWPGNRVSPEAIRKVAAALLEPCSCACPLPQEARYLLMQGSWGRNDGAR